MKKFLALIIALVMALSLVACGEQKQPETPDVPDNGGEQTATIKVGFITLHDENSTYDLNFINAAKEAIANLGLTENDYILKTNIEEGQKCYDTAAELADAGCNIIFADSFGHVLHDPGRQGLPQRAVLPLHRHQGAHREAQQLPQCVRLHL